uniref:Uncharacterized protein n=1 Tax=Strombidium rassoulzadegani TaxID=1082188 RepID=A0A7S3CI79_9SPIT|mmetsp:Transcript_11427/g.19305  ORF Transcript_11427/g.19305 Transcript_11427/m.19305 type:complete len:164 (+) Transcript_11427:449-940(+)
MLGANYLPESQFRNLSSDPINQYFNLIFQGVDSAMLFYYVSVNSYIWIRSAMLWCIVPKAIVGYAFFQLHPDKLAMIFTSYMGSSISTLVISVMYWEIMMAAQFKVEEVLPHLEEYTVADYFTAVNLDLAFILRSLRLNFAQWRLSRGRKQGSKDKAQVKKED